MFYQPVLDQRFFSADKLYSDVDWSNFGAVIDGFEIRMNDWYVTPGKMIRQASWNHAFAVMAMDCLLIDTLSQYYFGESSSSKTAFSDFAKLALPPFAAALPQPIRKDPSSTRPKVPYTTFADVLYSCFRCGILHEAHVALCGGVASLGGAMVDIAPVVSTRYDDGSGCPTVRIDPTIVFDELESFLSGYLAELRNPDPAFDGLRSNFKTKFASSFGVDISSAKL